MSINIILATNEDGAIGNKGKLLYKIKSDMQRFQNLTTHSSGHKNICVMGRRSFEEMKEPLSHRTNIVISTNKNYKAPKGVIVEHDIHKILNHYLESGEQDRDLWVCGGIRIFEEFLPFSDSIYLTLIHDSGKKADTYFDLTLLDSFEEVEKEEYWSDEYQCEYDFITYKRKGGVIEK
ncbi:dihydrofolate reductase [Ureibacillus chungkukjangi]|uniref:dihydrofolate reductase n=1 Tax=Ureibacillus chungkukjangi TaxID=1202712 RepID=UPI00203D2FA1|nr:dihydrofolate reductase [Ureibacillus chungkukjangi]